MVDMVHTEEKEAEEEMEVGEGMEVMEEAVSLEPWTLNCWC